MCFAIKMSILKIFLKLTPIKQYLAWSMPWLANLIYEEYQMTTITVKVPTRVDLAGGTIDLWPVHTLMDVAATVNFGINVFQTASIELTHASKSIQITSEDLNETLETTYNELTKSSDLALLRALVKEFWHGDFCGFHLRTKCDSPAGAGLGGSSCLSIAVASALVKARSCYEGKAFSLDERKLVETVQNIEARIIHAPTGCQDYWGGVRGRINILDFKTSGTEIETFHDDSVMEELEKYLVVAYSGQSRRSAMNNWQIYKNVFDGDQKTLNLLTEIGKLAYDLGAALKIKDFESVFRISKNEWEVRKELWSGIETNQTRELDDAARNAGAMFSRAFAVLAVVESWFFSVPLR